MAWPGVIRQRWRDNPRHILSPVQSSVTICDDGVTNMVTGLKGIEGFQSKILGLKLEDVKLVTTLFLVALAYNIGGKFQFTCEQKYDDIKRRSFFMISM